MATFGGIPTTYKDYQKSDFKKRQQYDALVKKSQFEEAVRNGFLAPDPTGLNGLLESDTYKAYGNNTQAYDGAYQEALARSRSNITQGLGAAMAELNQRRDAVNAQAALQPGQINDVYSRANAGIAQNTGAVQAIMAQGQVDPNLGPSQAAANAPVLAALAGNQAEALNNVAPLAGGINASLSKEGAALQMDAASRLSDIDMQAAEHESSRQSQSDEPSWMQKLMIENEQDRQNALSTKDPKKIKAAEDKQRRHSAYIAQAIPGVDPRNAPLFTKAFPNLAAGIKAGTEGKSSKAYGEALAAFRAIAADGKKHPQKADRAYQAKKAELLKKYPNQAHAISLADADSAPIGG